MDEFELEKMRWNPRSTPSKGPRRLCKFCILAILLPVTLLCIPLYMRFLALRPHSLILSPSDMKLLNHESIVSTTWCKSQKLRMNSTFHAYLFNERPKLTARKKKVVIKKKMEIADDMKKYWGFYLLKGSSIKLGGCARWAGSSVVIVKGPRDAERCAWLGELDSQEESDEFSNEFDVKTEFLEPALEYTKSTLEQTTENVIDEMQLMASFLNNFQIPKEKKTEILQILHKKQQQSPDNHFKRSINGLKGDTDQKTKLDSLEDQLNRDEYDDTDGGEDLSSYDYVEEDDRATEKPPPDHLRNAGLFDQRNSEHGKVENSREELRSSDSSSEEALRNCKGVISVHEFAGKKKCGGSETDSVLEWYPFTNTSSHHDHLRINQTGFYYFIFSNENEISNNTVIADIELNKTFFSTNASVEVCKNSTECELFLDFWSNQHVLVEVPSAIDEDPECETYGFNNFNKCKYIIRAETECQPRGEIYMVFLFLVPVIILLFAYI